MLIIHLSLWKNQFSHNASARESSVSKCLSPKSEPVIALKFSVSSGPWKKVTLFSQMNARWNGKFFLLFFLKHLFKWTEILWHVRLWERKYRSSVHSFISPQKYQIMFLTMDWLIYRITPISNKVPPRCIPFYFDCILTSCQNQEVHPNKWN